MLSSKSVKTRLLLSFASNIGRAAINFASVVLIARALSPTGYGDLTFLIGSFVAIRTMLDMGTSSAFYTFISKRRQTRGYYLVYFAWLVFQFISVALIVALILPQSMIQMIWLEHTRSAVLLALAAVFMQQQLWPTIIQIGEASRNTLRVQIMNVTVAVAHLVIIGALYLYGTLSVGLVFAIIIAEYAAASVWAWRFLADSAANVGAEPLAEMTFGEIFREYAVYCRPLILLSWIGFLYNFADTWLLQRFGGASQQGFYQAAFQFSAISLIATASVLNVFWKEIAESHGRGDLDRVTFLYSRINRGLLFFGAVVSGLLIPWSWHISVVFLGSAYAMAAPVIFIMLFFPIHQSMGQVGGTMLLASGKTYAYLLISGIFMAVSLPISYMIQAPSTGLIIPGLGLGATGMAVKMVVLNVASVNVQAWVVARYCKIKYEWLHQAIGIGGVVAIGFIAKSFAGIFWNLAETTNKAGLILPVAVTAAVYLPLVFGLVWAMPWLAGMDRGEIARAVKKGFGYIS